MLNLLKSTSFFFILICFWSCSKDKEFKDYYGGSGIWEIQSLKVEYKNQNGITDSVRTYTNCGMFIFYNYDIGANNVEYNGQIGITTFQEVHYGCAWYPEGNNLNIKTFAYNTPLRVYEVSGKGDERTWTYSGRNNNFLPGNIYNVNETLIVKRISTK